MSPTARWLLLIAFRIPAYFPFSHPFAVKWTLGVVQGEVLFIFAACRDFEKVFGICALELLIAEASGLWESSWMTKKKKKGVCVSGGHWQSSSLCCAPLNTPSGTFPSVEWGLNYLSYRLRLTAFIRRPGEEVSVITAHPFISSGGPFGTVRYTELTFSLIPHLNGRQQAERGPLPALDNPAQIP